MQACLNDTIGGYNSFLQTSDQSASISLYIFDHEFTEVYTNKLISKVQRLNRSTYTPRGTTALLDAIAKVLEIDETPKTVVIITDGEENASRRYTYQEIHTMIRDKKELGWKFIFMGANQDAIETACRLNIEEGSSLNFGTRNIVNAFRSASAAIQRSQDGQGLEFTQEERLLSC